MSALPLPAPRRQGPEIRLLVLVLAAVLGAMQVALWAYLGLPPAWFAAGLGALGGMLACLWRARGWRGHVPWPRLALCWAAALLVLALGGEGRWFYAPPDWQVRYAVLRDLTLNPWPFVLSHQQGPLVLRAPLGIYLLPALAGKALGTGLLSTARAAELVFLAQNSALLAILLALGSTLFARSRDRAVALGVFWLFSGVHQLTRLALMAPAWLGLGRWARLEISANLTQVVWAPPHALPGWAFAACYLLWLRGRAPAWAMVALVPLMALCSPLAAMGAMPFAMHGGLAALRRGQIGLLALAACALATLASLPGLLFLLSGSAQVGGALGGRFPLAGYGCFVALELGGYLAALLAAGRRQPLGATSSLIAAGFLLLAPFVSVGQGTDFVMRASVPAEAILSAKIALLVARGAAVPAWRGARGWALIMLVLGALSPLGELQRALTWPASPAVTCGYLGVIPKGFSTYTAPLQSLPRMIRPAHPRTVAPEAHPFCWARPWPDPVTGQATMKHPY